MYLRCVAIGFNLIQYTQNRANQRDAAINIADQKKESAELHKHIEGILPHMTRYRMNTDHMQQLKAKHFASLNAAKKLFSFIKSKL